MVMFRCNSILLACFFTLAVLSAHTCAEDTDTPVIENIPVSSEEKTQPKISNEYSFEEASEMTRAALMNPCGSCHQSSLDTHKPGAIAFFDLDKGPKWHSALVEENLHGIAKRTENKTTLTEQQKEAIAAFLTLKASRLKE